MYTPIIINQHPNAISMNEQQFFITSYNIVIIVKRLFNWQSIGILCIILVIKISTSSISVVTYADKSSSGSLQHNLSGGANHHTMSQMMQRGNVAMGFDQIKISHEFSPTKFGGQLKITALDDKDNQTISQIQSHTRDIQHDFAEGNFTKPFFIHAQSVPGTDAMTQNKDQIEYKIQELKNGSILLLITNNPSLVSAINQFMSYQSTEHKGH